MAKGKVAFSGYPVNAPDWYWTKGLHDAVVTGVECVAFPFDYNRFLREKNDYNRNCMTLKIDAGNALFDNSVKGIRFYNYKILSDGISLENRKEIWWLADRLVDHGAYYTLEIHLQDAHSYPENYVFKVKFERAEVER